jgi:hypothetical protein
MTEFLPQPGLLFTLATYILMVAVLVVVHEGGHYLAGRFFGVKIDAFAFGFGRELFGFNDRRGTRWKFNLAAAWRLCEVHRRHERCQPARCRNAGGFAGGGARGACSCLQAAVAARDHRCSQGR